MLALELTPKAARVEQKVQVVVVADTEDKVTCLPKVVLKVACRPGWKEAQSRGQPGVTRMAGRVTAWAQNRWL